MVGLGALTAGTRVNRKLRIATYSVAPKLSIHRYLLESCQNKECDPAGLYWGLGASILSEKLPSDASGPRITLLRARS